MNPDLDKRNEYIVNESLKSKDLGLSNDDEIKYADLYEDYNENKKSILSSNSISFEYVVLESTYRPKIVDIRPILSTDSDRFIDTLFAKLLGRRVEESDEDLIAPYKSKKISKLDLINAVVELDEFKKKDIIVTGYSEIKLENLTKYDGKKFINMAYIYVLGRMPDEGGRRNFLRIMKLGEITKEEILYDLINSREGRDNYINIIGLDEAYNKVIKSKQIYSKPIIGKILKYLNNVVHINARVNNIVEDMMSMDSLIDDNSNIFVSHINDIQIQLYMLNSRVERLKKVVDNLNNNDVKNETAVAQLTEEINALSIAIKKITVLNEETDV